MRILYVAMEHNYGRPDQGPSFEETNFRSALEGMGHELVRFDFMARDQAVGRRQTNAELRELAASAGHDVAFFAIFRDELSIDTIREVSRLGGAPTMNWFSDDHWRFDSFTRKYAPAFDWAITTDHESLPRYREIGHSNVILSQWACNRYAYSRTAESLEYDVTFVGQPHGDRREVIAALRDADLPVQCWGLGWPDGRLSHEEMVHVFGASRINLNLSNSSQPDWRDHVRALLRGSRARPRRSQIKGRTFEVPGSGGFLMTDAVPHLEEYFEIGTELATFRSTTELIDGIRHWLANPDERAAVAEAGYRRVLAEHTYDHRFARIFEAVGVS